MSIRNLDIPFVTPKINDALWSVNGLTIVASDAGGGFYIFRPADVASCRQVHLFFPTDFRISEWDPHRGQVDESTRTLTHEQGRSIVIDSDQVNCCVDYMPFTLEEVAKTAVFSPEIQNLWTLEEQWLRSLKDKKEKGEENESHQDENNFASMIEEEDDELSE